MAKDTIKSVVVDDVDMMRATLKKVLDGFPNIEIVGEASDYESAREVINDCKPDLVFLDIDLNGLTSIDLLNEIIHDYKVYKIVRFERYFKSYCHQHNNKVQVKLKLKDLAFFFHFVILCDLFEMHPNKTKNKKMLMDFFMKNFMYTNTNGDPVHFKNFTKEVTDTTSVS